MSIYYAAKAYVRSFSESVAEEIRDTGVTVTALCPGLTSTGFEKAAAMGSGSAMFRHAVSAEKVAAEGIRAIEAGKTLHYCGLFTKSANILSRLSPRAVSRKFALKMSR
jgi:short-subunit dehydrogenase